MSDLPKKNLDFLRSQGIVPEKIELFQKSPKLWSINPDGPWLDIETAALKSLETRERLSLDRRKLLVALSEASSVTKSKSRFPKDLILRTENYKFATLHLESKKIRQDKIYKCIEEINNWESIRRTIVDLYAASPRTKNNIGFRYHFPDKLNSDTPTEEFIEELYNCWRIFHSDLERMLEFTLLGDAVELRKKLVDLHIESSRNPNPEYLKINQESRLLRNELFKIQQERMKSLGKPLARRETDKIARQVEVEHPELHQRLIDNHRKILDLPEIPHNATTKTMSSEGIIELEKMLPSQRVPEADVNQWNEAYSIGDAITLDRIELVDWSDKNAEAIKVIKRLVSLDEKGWWLSKWHLDNTGSHDWIDLHLFDSSGEQIMAEVKGPGDRLTSNQIEYIPLAKAQGWKVRVIQITPI